jgi:hypothetical protein
MATKKKRARAAVEWVGGLVSMPAYVDGEGEPYRPELLVWVVADGPVIGYATAKPGELLAEAATHLRTVMASPLEGPPHVPDRVRVASPALAAALRDALPPAIELVCSPTPEVDHFVATMRENMLIDDGAEPSYLPPATEPEAVASMFRAAARLYRAKPWSLLPSGENLVFVTIESLGVGEAPLTILGRLGQALGFVLFRSVGEYDPLRRDVRRGRGG